NSNQCIASIRNNRHRPRGIMGDDAGPAAVESGATTSSTSTTT
ncbi:hypothetical protein A2U01_0110098, partial [Trifolium medium]|nr:hypothetical protein [Trifolium medium]